MKPDWAKFKLGSIKTWDQTADSKFPKKERVTFRFSCFYTLSVLSDDDSNDDNSEMMTTRIRMIIIMMTTRMLMTMMLMMMLVVKVGL